MGQADYEITTHESHKGLVPITLENGIPAYRLEQDDTDKHATRVQPYRVTNEHPHYRQSILDTIPHKRVATTIAAQNPLYFWQQGAEVCDGVDINLPQINHFASQHLGDHAPYELVKKYYTGENRLFNVNVFTAPDDVLDIFLGDKDLFFTSNIFDSCENPEQMSFHIQRLIDHMPEGANLMCSIVKSKMFDEAQSILEEHGYTVKRNADFGLPEPEAQVTDKMYHIDDFALISKA